MRNSLLTKKDVLLYRLIYSNRLKMKKVLCKETLSTEPIRCPWCLKDELYIRYHDEEWGVPVHDDIKHFEFLVLETFQAGLSWHTILKKRENFRKAFEDFVPDCVAGFGEEKFRSLMADAGIIRNKLKIEAAITNAGSFIKVQREFGTFNNYIWGFVNQKQVNNNWGQISEIPVKTELSDRISADMKKRGFKFAGSTIIYSHLQAIGIINDHITECFRYKMLRIT
jgi:DNA-3-methyladenine glycosylase I